jgi:hypothetical protein
MNWTHAIQFEADEKPFDPCKRYGFEESGRKVAHFFWDILG